MNKLLAFATAFIVTLVIVLVPVRVLELKSEAQVTEYEYEVLSGIDAGRYNLEITTGWHGDALADRHNIQSGIDFIYDQTAGWHAILRKDAYARFRHVGGERELSARILEPAHGVCKKVVIELFHSDSGSMAATISYIHVESSISVLKEIDKDIHDRTVWTLNRGQQVTTIDELLGFIVRERREGDDENKNLYGVENAYPRYGANGEFLDFKGCSSGPHLHQSIVQSGVSKIYLNDSSVPGKGLPDAVNGAHPCISPDEWIAKIVSPGRTPAVTATDAPTTTCPPTNLSLKSGSALTLEFDSPNAARFEIYKEEADGTFCDADASSCVHDGTAAAGATAGAVTFKKRSESETLSQAMRSQAWPSGKYRARGRGCVGSVCGAWSGWSDTDHIAPPTGLALKSSRDGQLGVHYARVDIPDAGWHEFALYQADMDGQFCDVCDALTTVPQPATRATPGENTEAPTLFGLQPERAYKARARSCRSGDPGPGGVPADNCGAWSDFTPTIYHASPPESIGLVSSSGNLGVSFKSLRAARFQLYTSSGSTCTVDGAGCTLVTTITAEASASAALRQATFGQRTGGTYWVRGQSCLTSGAGGTGGGGGAAGTPGPRVATNACGAWSALSPSSGHTASTVTPEPQCTLTVVANPAVGGTVSGGRTVNCSASTNLTAKAKPKPGYRFSHWSGDGTGTGASARTVTMSTDRSVTAHFVREEPPPVTQYTLTVRAFPTSCSQGVLGNGTKHDSGDTANFNVAWRENCGFVRWSSGVTDIRTSTSGRISAGKIVMSSDRTVTATLVPRYTLRTSVSESACGSVTGDNTVHDSLKKVTVTVRWNAGCRFTGWSAGVRELATNHVTRRSSGEVRMNSDWSITAGLAKKTYTLSVSVTKTARGYLHGSVTRTPWKAAYFHNDRVTLRANATPGYRFVKWSGAASGTSTTARIIMNGDKAAKAHFELIPLPPCDPTVPGSCACPPGVICGNADDEDEGG